MLPKDNEFLQMNRKVNNMFTEIHNMYFKLKRLKYEKF